MLPQTGTNIGTWYAQVAILLVLAGVALVLIGGSKDKND